MVKVVSAGVQEDADEADSEVGVLWIQWGRAPCEDKVGKMILARIDDLIRTTIRHATLK